jgi:hypothetical protein
MMDKSRVFIYSKDSLLGTKAIRRWTLGSICTNVHPRMQTRPIISQPMLSILAKKTKQNKTKTWHVLAPYRPECPNIYFYFLALNYLFSLMFQYSPNKSFVSNILPLTIVRLTELVGTLLGFL